MLHHVIIKQNPDFYYVQYEIHKKKPKSKANLLVSLIRSHQLLTHEDSHDVQIHEQENHYFISGAFYMTPQKYDYSTATEPAAILNKLVNQETSEIIKKVFTLAGEKKCQKQDQN
jgi:hypothetical protein